MVHILFEDNKNMPTSILLKKSCAGHLMEFKGCSRFINELNTFNKDEKYIIYLDLVPDNTETVINYNCFCRVIKENNIKNVIILPIICIEYIFMKALIKINMHNYFNYDLQTKLSNISNHGCLTLEKYYKKVLSDLYTENKCIKNKQNKMGYFYYKDCPCTSKPICNKGIQLDLVYKSNIFYTTLGYFYIDDIILECLRPYNIALDNSVHNIFSRIQSNYNKVCDLLDVPHLEIGEFYEFDGL